MNRLRAGLGSRWGELRRVSGQSAEVSFSGFNGEGVKSTTSAGTFAAKLRRPTLLKAPSGSVLQGPVCAGQAGSLPQTTLAANGTYKILVQPDPGPTASLKLPLELRHDRARPARA